MNHLNSKRFVAFAIGMATILVLYTKTYDPLQVAGGISLICAIYTGAETYRRSDTLK